MRYLFDPAPPTTVAIRGQVEVFPVRRVFCVAKNYAAHIAEMGGDPHRSAPFFFAKPADAVRGNPETIPYPGATRNLHHEVELVVAIDACGHDVEPHEADMLVYGFAVGIDLTRRDLQTEAKKKGQPWVTAKGFDHSAPVSSVTPMKCKHLDTEAAIQLLVNDELRQDGQLGAMIWSVPELLANLSRYFSLKPGDLIFTGTPAGVGPLVRGDRVRALIEDIGSLEFRIV